MRLFLLFFVVASIFLIPVFIYGDRLDGFLGGSAGVDWLRGFGPLAGVVGIGLIVADLVLPEPTPAVMTALGILYGAFVGGLLSTFASILTGGIAYTAARLLGRRAAVALVGERDIERARGFFARAGGYAIVVSRAMPLLAEVIACLAGLAGMTAGRFFTALTIGSVPLGFAFAYLGARGQDHPVAAILVSVFLPLMLWPVARRLMRATPDRQPAPEGVS